MATLEAREQNLFSEIERESLPISAEQIVKAAVRSPEELQAKSIGYAVMARDIELLCDKYEEFIIDYLDVSILHSFRLQGSDLSGGKLFRSMLMFLANRIAPTEPSSIKKLYISHTSYTPAVE
ncbi:hypothetical protein G7054_g644 [Neopestalotiopsis clavispora]|nr:hypothetical protein G7054_g644 [Neopestalotiopsis clavispora]